LSLEDNGFKDSEDSGEGGNRTRPERVFFTVDLGKKLGGTSSQLPREGRRKIGLLLNVER